MPDSKWKGKQDWVKIRGVFGTQEAKFLVSKHLLERSVTRCKVWTPDMSFTQRAFSLVNLFRDERLSMMELKNRKRASILFEAQEFMITTFFRENPDRVILSTMVYLGGTVAVDVQDEVFVLSSDAPGHPTTVYRKTQRKAV